LYLDFLPCYITELEFPAWEPLEGRMGRLACKNLKRKASKLKQVFV
jgi:hypothetical protein